MSRPGIMELIAALVALTDSILSGARQHREHYAYLVTGSYRMDPAHLGQGKHRSSDIARQRSSSSGT